MLKKWWNKPITNGTIVKNWVSSIVATALLYGAIGLYSKGYVAGKKVNEEPEAEDVTEETTEE